MVSASSPNAVSEFVERAWNQGDLEAVDEYVHENYVRHTATGDVIGREGFKQRIRMMRAAFPDFRSEIQETIAEGDRRAARFQNRGTHLGEFFGIAPTGRTIEFTNSVVVHLRDGLLYEEWEFLDTAAVLGPLTRPD